MASVALVVLLLSMLSAWWSVAESGDMDWEGKLVSVLQMDARFRAKWCSSVHLDDETLRAVFACQYITILDQHELKRAYDTCLKVVFGSLRSHDYAYIRQESCHRPDANKLFVKCLVDIHWKRQPEIMQQLTKKSSKRESLMRLLPVLMERIQCQSDAIHVSPFQDSDANEVRDTKVDMNSINLSLLLSTALNKRS